MLKIYYKKISELINSSKKAAIWGIFFIFFVYFILLFFPAKLLFKFVNYIVSGHEINNDIIAFVSGMLINVVFLKSAVILLILFVLKLYNLTPEDIGWSKIKSIWKILVGIIIVFIYHVLCPIGILFSKNKCLPTCFIEVKFPTFVNLEPWYLLILAILIAPVIEELFFRGFIQTSLEKKLNFVDALFITSMLFAALHFHRINHIHDFFVFFGHGLIYGLLRKWDNSLWSCSIAHIALNISSNWLPVICK